jgi:Domain of unknown function (DUF4389)
VPDYPAHLEIASPERLSRGLVKWWLLAPDRGHLCRRGSWLVWNSANGNVAIYGNLIGLLVLIAAVILAATGRYSKPLFDLLLGLNRWVIRVAAYAGLMTDQYPPFRLDLGGREPGGSLPTAPPPRTGWSGKVGHP